MWKPLICLFATSMLFAGGKKSHGAIVDFTECLTQSKYGKKEQENFESLRKQITNVMQETEKQINDLAQKLEDPDYMDSLSPKAEEELKLKKQSLTEDMSRYQNEFYQSLSQANYIIHQRLHANVSKAAEKIAKDNKLSFVISKDSCFYYNPDMEITPEILKEMDKNFELESISDNKEEQPALEEESATNVQ